MKTLYLARAVALNGQQSRRFGLVVIIALFVYFVLVTPIQAQDGIEAHLHLHPSGGLFEAENMAPGDRVHAQLSITNDGQVALQYAGSARKQAGSDLFYEMLDLVISDSSSTIYAGKLADLETFAFGELNVDEEQVYTFTVRFPLHAGNEYQGKSVRVAFDFEYTVDTRDPGDGNGDNGDGEDPGDDNGDNGDGKDPGDDNGDNGDGEDPGDDNGDNGDGEDPGDDNGDNGDGDAPDDRSGNEAEGDRASENNEREDAAAETEEHSDSVVLPDTSTPWYNVLAVALIGMAVSGAWIVTVVYRRYRIGIQQGE